MSRKFCYTVYGFQLESELELPELLPGDGAADVTVSFDSVPISLEGSTVKAFRYESTSNDFLLKVDATANFLVSNGKKITIDIFGELNEEKIRTIFLSSVLGALCYQRGLLPFLGSAVCLDGVATLFLRSFKKYGASTLAALCCNKGYRLLSDKLVVFSFQEELMVLPSYPEIALWNDSLSIFGASNEKLQRVRTGLEKFSKKYPHQFSAKPVAVNKIYLLCSGDAEVTYASDISSAEAMQSLLECGYHTDFLACKSKKQLHFYRCAELVKKIPIRKLYPGNSVTDNGLLQTISRK